MPATRKPASRKVFSGSRAVRKGLESAQKPAQSPLETVPKCPDWIKSRRGRAFYREKAELMVSAGTLTAENAGLLAALAAAHGKIADASATDEPIQAAMLSEYRRLHADLGLVQPGKTDDARRVPGGAFAYHALPTDVKRRLWQAGIRSSDFE